MAFLYRQLIFNILTKTLYGHKYKRVEMGLVMTSLAVNELTGSLAVGTQYGEITLMRGVADYLRHFYYKSFRESSATHHSKAGESFDSIVVKSALTWHSHAVKALAFTGDGRLLYSGGEESVLTLWNLNKSIKSFIPRVGGPISHLIAFQ
jgi:NET1-associated nuclear protein 1 (U3 small nucleolar RNA-associated protein 17)